MDMAERDTPDRNPDAPTAPRLSEAALLDLLAQARAGAHALDAADAVEWEAALSALEAEAAARGLTLPGPRERRPVAIARKRLAERLRSGGAEDLLEVVPDLDPRGLYAIFRFAVDRLPAAERLRVLEALFARLDELHFDPRAAHRRRRRYLRPELPLERRIERVRKAVAFQFRTLHRLGA